jgi:Na+/melibiose symporter-like transporter
VLLFFSAWTMAFIPYLAQGTELSDDYAVKNRINVTQSAVMLTALLCAFTVPLLLVDPKAGFVRAAAARVSDGILPPGIIAFLEAPAATGAAYYGRSMLVITVLALAPLAVALPGYVLRVRERLLAPSVGRGSLTSALRNPVFLRFAFGYLLLMIGYMGRGGLMPILLTVGLRLPDTYLFFMMLTFSSSLVITPIWARLLRRFDRITCIVLAAAIEATGLAMLFLIPGGSVALTAIAFVIIGLPGQTLLMIPFLVAADASDYARWRTGADSRAIHISLVSLIVKLGSVYAGASIWLAGSAGLDLGRRVQTSETIFLVKCIGLGVPVLCLIAGSFFVLRFPLNRRRHAAIRLRLDRRDRSTAVLQQRPPYLGR